MKRIEQIEFLRCDGQALKRLAHAETKHAEFPPRRGGVYPV